MDFKDIVQQRRAVNLFDTEKDVPEPLLREMFEMAAKAPSSFNLQPWNVIVLRDASDKLRLQKLAWDQPKVSEAPVTLIVLADTSGWMDGNPTFDKNFEEMVKAGSMEPGQREWLINATTGLYGSTDDRKMSFACKNTGFFAMALMFAAKSLGMDTHPMDGFDIDGVRKEFRIPDRYWIPLLLSVGYFRKGESLAPPKWRKTYDEIVVKFD